MPADPRDTLRTRIGISAVLIFVLLASGTGIFLFLKSLKKEAEKKGAAPPRTVVRTESAARQSWREELSGYGLARSLRSASVAAEVAGVVEWVSPDLEAGNPVDTRTELVKIASRDYAEFVAAAAARKDQARSAADRLGLDLASVRKRLVISREDLLASERELTRISGLTEKGVFTASDLDRQKIATSLRQREIIELEAQENSLGKELERANSEMEAARATWERARIDLERTTIRAPFPGLVERRRISPGARVGLGAILFDLVDLGRIEVPVALGASRFGEVEVGAKAVVRLREDGPVVWEGTVARLAPVVDSTERTFLAYLEVTAGAVPPGAFVLATIDGPIHEDVIPVPRTAFVENRIFVAEPQEDGTAIIRVRTPEVARWLPSVALVRDGIRDGERIVVTNIEQIAEGSRVQLVRDEEKAP